MSFQESLKNKATNIWYNIAFYPGFLGLFLNPFYFARKDLVFHVSKLAKFIDGKTLDLGCGGKNYEKLCASSEYIGLEVDSEYNRRTKKADFFYDGSSIPFSDNCFDSVFSSQVFEHVEDPNKFLSEVQRVLKPNGKLLITVPLVWAEHEQPYDFFRYTSFGLVSILKANGFEVLELKKSVDDIRAIFQIIILYIHKFILTRSKIVNLILVFFLISPWNVLGQLLYWVTPKHADLYLNNVVLAQKVNCKADDSSGQ